MTGRGKGKGQVVQFGLRVRSVKREIPAASLRAGSSLGLKNSYAQDDKVVERAKSRSWV
jgi:hypothetical protein